MMLLLVMVASVGWGADAWVKTSPADLKTGDVVVIVDQTSSKAMSNDKGTSSAPSAVAVTLNDSKSEIAGTVTSNIQWEVTVTTEDSSNSYKFGVSGTINCLYSTDTNNGLRVGTGENNTYTIITGGDNDGYYLQSTTLTRFVGCYNSSDWRNYGSINANIKGNNTAFYKKVTVAVAVEAPTFSVAEGTYTSAKSVELSCVTEGATIYYTTDGTEPTAASTAYTGAISISETTTLKAIAVKGEDVSSVASATYTIVNIEHAGTEADPYTVADARNAIDANFGITGVYATGIVSKIVTAYDSGFANITFDFVDSEGETNSIRAYRCTGNEAENVQVGDRVVVSGNLTLYNSIYEFSQGCQLVSLEHSQKDDPELSFSAETATATIGETFTAPTLSTVDGFNGTITYTSSNTNVATIDEETGAVTLVGVGTTTITASFDGDDTYKSDEASYTLTVKNNFTITDGEFDFTQGENYGSGYEASTVKVQSGTWTAVNVNMALAGRNCWYEASDLRLYAESGSSAAGTMTFTVPEGNIITAIVFEGSAVNPISPSSGSYKEGTWSGTAESLTFTATNTAKITKITVTYGVGTVKEDVTMEFSATSATATLGEDFTAPTLTTTPSGLDVTYSSSDENVATVAADGTVTLVAAGTTKITASFAGNETYNAGEASYTLTVKEKEAEKTLVTVDADGNVTFDLTDNAWGFPTSGGTTEETYTNSGYSIKVYAPNEFKFVSQGYLFFGKSGAYLTLPAFDFDVDKIDVVGRNGASGSTKQNIYVGDNAVSTETTGVTETNTYEIAKDYQTAGTIYTIKVCSAHNDQITSIKVYKKQAAPANITLSPAKEYTTLTSAYALDFSAVDGLAAYIVKEEDVTATSVKLTQVRKVPANTGLVLQKTGTARDYVVPTFDGTDADDVSLNKMAGSATNTTAIAENAGYILKDGKFSPSAEGTLAAGKAYLAVSVLAGAKDLNIVFGEGTGINNVNVNENESGKIFNLAGQQMKSAVKGVYIKNGKKYIK